MPSLKGQFLIASPSLTDPNFFRTVVLMVQHDDNGALGLIVNRPLETNIKDAWDQVSQSPCDVDAAIHEGGPVDGPLMLLHTNPAYPDIEVLPGLYFTTERESVEQLVSHNNCTMKFFVNYSGWGPGQLEGELEAGGWLTAPADPNIVFADADALWPQLYKLLSTPAVFKNLNPKVIPPDPSMN